MSLPRESYYDRNAARRKAAGYLTYDDLNAMPERDAKDAILSTEILTGSQRERFAGKGTK